MGRILDDLTGRTFGRLTVIKRAENGKYGKVRWLCICECGNETIVAAGDLRNGIVVSCKCFVKSKTSERCLKDLAGRIFGKLTVIRRIKENNKHGHAHWLCKCLCGNEIITGGSELRRGNVKSCGCIGGITGINDLQEEIDFNRIIRQYKQSAKNRRLLYSLTDEDALKLISSECYYCNVPLAKGIDRIDSSGGYISGNVLPCCKLCNIIKLDLSIDDFYDMVNSIYRNLNLLEYDGI
jgi:hypothetical protein